MSQCMTSQKRFSQQPKPHQNGEQGSTQTLVAAIIAAVIALPLTLVLLLGSAAGQPGPHIVRQYSERYQGGVRIVTYWSDDRYTWSPISR